jgi:hypothetical protein
VDGTPRIRSKGNTDSKGDTDIVFSVLDTLDGDLNEKLRDIFECRPVVKAAFISATEPAKDRYLRKWRASSGLTSSDHRRKVNRSFVSSDDMSAKIEDMVEKHIELLEDSYPVSDSVVAFVAAAFGCLAALAALPDEARNAIVNCAMALGLL